MLKGVFITLKSFCFASCGDNFLTMERNQFQQTPFEFFIIHMARIHYGNRRQFMCWNDYLPSTEKGESINRGMHTEASKNISND
jgi:hypothetical protein